MNKELDFSEYGESLAQSLFADRILLAVARFERLGTLDEESRKSIEKGKEFLVDIASVATQGAEVSERSIALAKAFEQAVGAISDTVLSKSEFVNHMVQLQRTLDNMLNGGQASPEDVDALNTFFSNYGAGQFGRSQDLVESLAR